GLDVATGFGRCVLFGCCHVPCHSTSDVPACAPNAIREQGLRLCSRRPDTSRRAPHLARGLDHEAELGELAFLVHRVAADAAGKSALWAQCELLQRGVLARLVDATL